ncbi:MAG: hypothetical protein KatS3mg095_0301 [Candidatus Parcubacteria bacterium]|nr:MAG: hypothetical protein KatS3mg095_0301 [Candidatus Parcubacteria bacterium]
MKRPSRKDKSQKRNQPSLEENPQQPEQTSESKEASQSSSDQIEREIKGPTLEDLNNILNELMGEEKYKELISKLSIEDQKLLEEIIKNHIEELKFELETKIEDKRIALELQLQQQGTQSKLTDEELRRFAEVRVLQGYEGKSGVERLLRLYLALFLLSNESFVEDEQVKNFIENELTLEEIEYIVKIMKGHKVVFVITSENKRDKIKLELKSAVFKISEKWGIYLEGILHERSILIKELKKYYRILREKAKKLGKDEKEIRELLEKFKDVDIDEIIKKSKAGEIKAYLEFLKNIIETLEKAEKESKETGKPIAETSAWKKFVEGAKDTATILAGLGLSGFLLWFSLIGFFLPVWVIERLRKEIKI